MAFRCSTARSCGSTSKHSLCRSLRPPIAGDWVILASTTVVRRVFVAFSRPDRIYRGVPRGPGEVSRVLMHLVGHTHRNHASIIPGTNPYLRSRPAPSSTIAGGRILDVFIAADGESARVESRMFSHAKSDHPSAGSYRRARSTGGGNTNPASGRTRSTRPGPRGTAPFTVSCGAEPTPRSSLNQRVSIRA